MENIYYVYVYLNIQKPGIFKYSDYTFEYEPFYIGKGKNNRLNDHLNKVKGKLKYTKSHKYKIIEDIVNSNLNPIIIKLHESLLEDDALSLERKLIIDIGRLDLNNGPLANKTDGGFKPLCNYRHSKETIDKIKYSANNRILKNGYELISPSGEIFNNINISKFCTENNLEFHKIKKSANRGEIKVKITKNIKQTTLNCIGWTVINNKRCNLDKRKISRILIDPDGNVFNFKNVDKNFTKFIEENNLNSRMLIMYRNKGKIKIRNKNKCINISTLNLEGWEYIIVDKHELIKEFSSKRKPIFEVVDVFDNIYQVTNLLKFSKENKLSYRTLNTFIDRGKINMIIRKNYSDLILNTIGWEIKRMKL